MKVNSRKKLSSAITKLSPPIAALTALALAVPAAAAPRAAERSGAIQQTAASQSAASRAASAAQPRLSGHVPVAAVAHARLLGRVAAAQTVGLALTLPLRNQAALSDLLTRLYTPGDLLCGKFLTPAEFTERFGPTAGDYAAVAAAAQNAGLQVTGTHPNRLILDVSGPVSAVEAAFALHLQNYRAADGRVFRAPDAGPRLPHGMAGRVAQVVGLDTALRLRSHLRPSLVPSVLAGRTGSGPGGGLSPSDIKTAYSLNSVSANGSGQSIALFELDGYTASDITGYEANFGLPAVPLQNILVDGVSGGAGSGADEVTLDIELAQALAPNVSKIYVYETPNVNNTQNYLDGYNRIATDDLAKQVSTSWGGPEDGSDTALIHGENTIFQQMAAQGQSVFAVTGDNGAYDDGMTLSVDDPGSQPYVTGVGGTTLATNGTGGPYAAESAWGLAYNINDPNSTGGGSYGVGGGGGFSAVWPTPSYQAALVPTPSMRSVPDVALNSDPETGYSIYVGGSWNVYGGTSAAAPLWAGFAALVNQQRAAAGKAPVGFLNPIIYGIGASAAYSTDFHDVTRGNNLYYPAAAGYDNATGWGSLVGDALLSTLVSGLPAAAASTLTGTITAADTNAPLPNVTVSALSSPGGVSVGTTTTNTAGVYTLPVPAGQSLSVTVSAYAATSGAYAGAKLPAAAAAAGASETINAALRPAHTFPAGLQMISSPYDYTGLGDFAAIFGLGYPTARLVAWNASAAAYVFYPNAPANTLTPGTGYWVSLPNAAYPHFDGALVPTATPFSLALATGWNLIGDPFPAAVPLSSVTANGTALTSSPVSPTLYSYSTASGQYVSVNAAADSLQPYAGYWIYTASPVTLNIPAP